MSERSKAQAARDERLRAALRENLKRRKAQLRGREPASQPKPASGRKPEDEKNDA